MSPPASHVDTPRRLTESDFISMLEKHQRRRNQEEVCSNLVCSVWHPYSPCTFGGVKHTQPFSSPMEYA